MQSDEPGMAALQAWTIGSGQGRDGLGYLLLALSPNRELKTRTVGDTASKRKL